MNEKETEAFKEFVDLIAKQNPDLNRETIVERMLIARKVIKENAVEGKEAFTEIIRLFVIGEIRENDGTPTMGDLIVALSAAEKKEQVTKPDAYGIIEGRAKYKGEEYILTLKKAEKEEK